MLGLRVGTYTFVVDAPGYIPLQGQGAVRSGTAPPIDSRSSVSLD
jgi:hypothetical protein